MVYISHRYRFIFIENPKSGSTSILNALQKSLNEKFQREMFPQVAHITPYELKKKISPDTWRDYLKVTTTRDPFDRFCSSMNFSLHKFDKTPDGLAKHQKVNKYCIYCLPQSEFTRECDFLINLNNIQEDYNTFCEKVGIPKTVVKNCNVSKKKVFSKEFLKPFFKI